MQTDHGQVPDFPKVSAAITEETMGFISVNGVSRAVVGEDIAATRTAVVLTNSSRSICRLNYRHNRTARSSASVAWIPTPS